MVIIVFAIAAICVLAYISVWIAFAALIIRHFDKIVITFGGIIAFCYVLESLGKF